jgi:hypothetical protein
MSDQEHHPIENMATLPFSAEWRYRPYDIATVLQPGETRSICDLRKHGYVVWGGVTHSNPLLSCTIKLETGTEEYANTFTCNDLFLANLVAPTPSGWWVSRYDVLNGVFSVMFTPSQWWPFYRRLNVFLTNPTAAPIQVFRASVLCIEFLEKVA